MIATFCTPPPTFESVVRRAEVWNRRRPRRPALAIEDRDADGVRARGHGDAEAPRVLHRDARAVDGHVRAASRPRRRRRATAHRELVFGVERERVLHDHAAARAERQPLDVPVLRQRRAARR